MQPLKSSRRDLKDRYSASPDLELTRPDLDHKTDYSSLIGRKVADIITIKYREILEEGIREIAPKALKDAEFMHKYLCFWCSCDARTWSASPSISLTYGHHWKGRPLEICPPDEWVGKAFKSLVEALETGLVGVMGYREPVERVDQAPVQVPYQVFDDRLWQIHREKSRLEVLNREGKVEEVYRRAYLSTSDGSGFPTSQSPGVGPSRPAFTAQLRELMRKQDLERSGTQRIAREIITQNPELRISHRDLRGIIDECRGHKHPRGRIKGVPRR